MILVAKVIHPTFEFLVPNISRIADEASDIDDGAQGRSDARLEDKKIFGLARSSSFRHIMVDAAPLFWIGIYSIWDEVTKRSLSSIQSVQLYFPEAIGSSDLFRQELRWVLDTRMSVFEGDHYWVGRVGAMGVLVWSFGFVLLIGAAILKYSNKLQEFSMLRGFGFFYNGFERKCWWWELIVKRMDA